MNLEQQPPELPPRHIGLFTQAVLLVGDWVSQTGWALLALGSVFFWTTTVNSDFGEARKAGTVWKKKAGVILSADTTGTLEGVKQIWHYRHSFALDGQRHTGESFSVGKKFDEGQIAFIQFDPAAPSNNFLVGLRPKQFDKKINWLLLIPLLGIPLLIWPIRANMKFIRLLKIGDFTRGKLMGKEGTGKSRKVGAMVLPIMRYDFAFKYKNAEYLATCKTHSTHLVEDETSERILFDRFEPTFNLVYDAVQSVPEIGKNGRLLPLEGWRGWVLFLPTFTVFFNLVFYWLR